jgi:hypothetical protein
MTDGRAGGHLRLISAEDDQDDASPESPSDSISAEDEEVASAEPFHKHNRDQMEDKDVQRLEDRIEAAEERGRLRLEVAMARIDGKLDGLASSIQETNRLSTTQASESAARHRELRNTVIATGLAVHFGIVATLIGLKQVWIGGVQVGLPLGQATQVQSTQSSQPVQPQQPQPATPVVPTPGSKPNG